MIHKSLVVDIVGTGMELNVGWNGSCLIAGRGCLGEGMNALGEGKNSLVVLGKSLMEASSCWKLVECKFLMEPERIGFDTELGIVLAHNAAPWLERTVL